MIRRVAIPIILFLFSGALWGDELVIPAGSATVRSKGASWNETGWNLSTVGELGNWVRLPTTAVRRVTILAAGTPVGDAWPKMLVSVTICRDGAMVNALEEVVTVDSRELRTHPFEVELPAGDAFLRVSFFKDSGPARTGEDGNLLLSELRIEDAQRLSEPPIWWLPFGRDAEQLKKRTNKAIALHRMATLTIYTQRGARVEVHQQRHAFGFGTALNSTIFQEDTPRTTRDKYLQMVADNFNLAMHEDALNSSITEATQGNYDFRMADRICQWCAHHDIVMRGHCLFCGVPESVPHWQQQLDDQALRAAIKQRAIVVTSHYRDRMEEFDVNSEMLHGSYYMDRLGPQIHDDMFRWATAGNRHARLYVDDYDILTGEGIAAGLYLRQIRDMLTRGVPVGGIGCQGHFQATFDPNYIQRTLDELAQLNLPIKITECDFATPGEMAKAEHLEQFLRICFAHPKVEGILLTGFWQGVMQECAALWQTDWSPTPAAEAYRRLVFSEWWTDFHGRADDEGVCRVRVFRGTHHVRINGKASTLVVIPLDAQEARVSVR